MKHKVAVKHPGKPLEIVEIEAQYRTDVKSLISNNDDTILQFVIMEQTGDRVFCFACDEEGLYKNLPLNFEMLTQNGQTSFLSRVVGTVVFLVYELEDVCDHDIWDFKICDISDRDIKLAEHLIKPETQKRARKIAKMDPHIHDKPEFVIRPIDNLEDFLNESSTSLHQIPSYCIPLAIFGQFNVGKLIEFYSDPAGKQKYVAGIRVEIGGCVVFYCKNETTAQNFEIKHYLLDKGDISTQVAEQYLQKYLKAMFKLGLPAFLYVSQETYNKYFA